MFPLEPQEQFTIVRQLADHTDSTTYYVRATIRDAKTDVLIDRFALADKGDRRFSQNWLVVADTSGLGKYISILTEVFTDSGYSTKAGTYGDEISTYKIQESKAALGGGGSVSYGTGVDYKLIRKIFEKLLDEKIKPFPQVQLPKMRFNELLAAVYDVRDTVNSIEIPQPKEITPTDLQPVISAIDASQNAILEAVASIPGRDKNDIQPLVDAIASLDVEKLTASIGETASEVAKALEDTVEDFSKVLGEMGEFNEQSGEIKETVADLVRDSKDILYNMTMSGQNAKSMVTQRKTEEREKDPKIARITSRLLKK